MIPEEFRPKTQNQPNDQFNILFQDEEQEDESPHNVVKIGLYSYALKCPPDIGTLFAHQVWSGSIVMAEYIHQNPQLVNQKRTIEFGSGTALPSLISLSLNSAFSMITDYPNNELLSSLHETIGLNWNMIHPSNNNNEDECNRVKVTGHEWGKDVSNLTHKKYDVALASECLWMHREHASLAKSIYNVLEMGGIALFTYAHHVPGCEEMDLNFFKLCRETYSMEVCNLLERDMPYMWNNTLSTKIYLAMVKKVL